MLQIEKKGVSKKWVSPTKTVLNTDINYDTKFYYSQNCPHNLLLSVCRIYFGWGEVTWISHFWEFLNCPIFWSDSFNTVLPPNKLPWVANCDGFQCIASIGCPGPDGFQNIMTSVCYSFPHGLIEIRVIMKWFYRLQCIVSNKIKCTNGKLTYILINKMGTALSEGYGTTTSTTSTTAAITNLIYLEGYSLCLAF